MELANNKDIRAFVMNCMSYTGSNRRFIKREQWENAYLLADGMGVIDYNFAQNTLEWDWSHVRDSSEPALLIIYNYLQPIVKVHSEEVQ